MTQKTTDIVKQVVGFLTAMSMFLGTIGFAFDWFNADSINAFGVFLGATIALGYTLYAVYTNTFGSKKAFDKAADKAAVRAEEEGEIPVIITAPEDVVPEFANDASDFVEKD